MVTGVDKWAAGRSLRPEPGDASAMIRDAVNRIMVGAHPCGRPGVERHLVGGRYLYVIFFLCFLFFLFPFSTAHADSTGTITGQLLNGTHDNAPMAGQSVTLQMAQGGKSKDLANVTTDAHGTFMFPNLAIDKTIGYAVYIRYQGAQYYSDLINLANKSQQQVNLTVYEATTSTANIAVVQATILVHKPDPQKGIINVSEFYICKNLDTTHSYVGSLDASNGKPNALRFSLPHSARNVSLSTGFEGYKAIAVDRGFASDVALLPGVSQFAFAFEIPYSTSDYDFGYMPSLPTVQLSFMVPTDIHASSDVLKSQGVKTADQHPYFLFQGSQLLPGNEIHAELQGLPVVAPPASSSPLNAQPVFWLIAAALVMVAILLVTLFLYRFTHRGTSAKTTTKQAVKQQSPKDRDEQKAVAPRAKKELSNDRQETLLQELLKLDKAFEAGKIKKAAYQEKRASLKAQLRTLMSEDAKGRVVSDPGTKLKIDAGTKQKGK